MILIGIGPGCGMPETYQITSALKHVKDGDKIALITDGRFSGVSTGACIGHVSPEAWAGGPIGCIRDGDTIAIEIDTINLNGSIDIVSITSEELEARGMHPELKPDPKVPNDTKLWAALQNASGGSWAGSVYDIDRITELLEKGMEAEKADRQAART